MDKQLCFKLNNDELYLDQTLVDYNGIPIFFISFTNKEYYLILCTDCKNYNYNIVIISVSDIYNLLHQKITMKDVILTQEEYWEVISGNEISNDIVTKKSINEIDFSCLPKEGFYYTVKL